MAEVKREVFKTDTNAEGMTSNNLPAPQQTAGTQIIAQPEQKEPLGSKLKKVVKGAWEDVGYNMMLDLIYNYTNEILIKLIYKEKANNINRVNARRLGGQPMVTDFRNGRNNKPTDKKKVVDRFTYKNLVLDQYEAEDVISTLRKLIRLYGKARVDELYQYPSIQKKLNEEGYILENFTLNNWGWTNLDNADKRAYGDSNIRGFILILPDPVPLKA